MGRMRRGITVNKGYPLAYRGRISSEYLGSSFFGQRWVDAAAAVCVLNAAHAAAAAATLISLTDGEIRERRRQREGGKRPITFLAAAQITRTKLAHIIAHLDG